MEIECTVCGDCCRKPWLLRLTSKREKKLFRHQLVCGEFIWTNECPYLMKNNKCKIHGERQPQRCKEYFCEGRKIN